MDTSTTPAALRERLIQGLQDDLAREYTAIIQYVIFSQKLGEARYMDVAGELERHAHQELDHALAYRPTTRLLRRLPGPYTRLGPRLRKQ